MRRYDVLVLGGGPAGAATALALRQRERGVAILSRRRGRPLAVGETVPPAIIQPLAKLGLWERFLEDGHARSPGTVVAWGRDVPYESDHIFDLHGCGWHLNRELFDQRIRTSARTAGAEVIFADAINGVYEAQEGWNVVIKCPDGTERVLASIIVDATGRAASFARCRGAVRETVDRLIGLVRFGASHNANDFRTTIESSEQGWWYAAALPKQRFVAAYFTDIDLIPRGSAARLQLWSRLLQATTLISRKCATVQFDLPLRITSASSGNLSRVSGPNWIAVGDAARTDDPISGQGITKALTDAVEAAEAICVRTPEPFGGPEFRFHRRLQEYRINHALHYGREIRWPDSRFWCRRRILQSSALRGVTGAELKGRSAERLPSPHTSDV